MDVEWIGEWTWGRSRDALGGLPTSVVRLPLYKFHKIMKELRVLFRLGHTSSDVCFV